MINIQPLSQMDPASKNKSLGNDTITIGKFGCLLTSMTMVANSYGFKETPDTLLAKLEPELFLKIYTLGRDRYETDMKTYHVSAELSKLPQTDDLPSLLDNFHAREVLHVTFGSALRQFGDEIKSALVKHADVYNENLQRHFRKHLDLLK